MRQARTRNTINLNAPPAKRRTPPPIPPRPLFRLGSLTSKPLPAPPAPPSPPTSPESELCDCVLCPVMRASVSPPSSTAASPDTNSRPTELLVPTTRKSSEASTSKASGSSDEPAALGKKRRIRAKAHLAPAPDSGDIILSLDDLPAWTIGFPRDRRVKEALRLSLSCGGIDIESEADIGSLRHDSGLDFGEDPRLADLMWSRGCHFTFNFW